VVSDATITLAYAGGHAVTALTNLLIGYWVVFRTEMRARKLFGLYTVAATLWALLSAGVVMVADPRLVPILWGFWSASAALSNLLILVFAAVFTGRDWRQNWFVRLLGGMYVVLIPVALTAPFHDFYWASVTVLRTPFVHVDVTPGPLNLLVIITVFVGLGAEVYYFVELYFKSRHRPSFALLVVVAGVIVGLLPFAISRSIGVLVETYDHTSFGVAVYALSFAYAAFRLDLADVTPVARDKAIDDLGDPYLAVDNQRCLADYNAAAEWLFSVETPDVGTPLADVAPTLADQIEAMDGRATNHTELTYTTEDTDRQFDLRTSPIRGPRDERRGTQILLRDITELKQREHELERQNERLDKFASVVSHDLRNPLGIADTYLDFARETGDEDDFDTVAAAHERMETMIDDLLTMARSETVVTAREPIDLETLATDAWETAQTDGATLEASLDDELQIAGDPDLLQNALENLFRNAAEHGAGDNDATGADCDTEVRVTVGKLDDSSGFYLEDNGLGIPPQDREDIFDHGYTTDDEGTGLGLFIVAELIEAHGWTITVSESDEGGARFEIHTDE
jgi:signal transduction histidine kinase